ncbi:MAG: CRISPR-associated RAMP protein Csx7 [Thermoproteota archaeon]
MSGAMYYMDFDEIKVTYIIVGKLVNQTPLSIGSGRGAFGAVDNPIVRLNNIPYIPGSSLKGVLRSEAERYVKTLSPSEFVCDIFNPTDENKGELALKDKQKENYNPCIICRIFGGPTIASHLRVRNAMALSPYRTEMRTSVSINRITGGQYPGRLYDIEYVVPLTKFDFLMEVENIDLLGKSKEAEVANHLIAFLMSGNAWLGGRKSIGMGNVKLTEVRVRKIGLKRDKFVEEDVSEEFLKEVIK